MLAGKEAVQSRSSMDTVAEGMCCSFQGEHSFDTGWNSSQTRLPPIVPPASWTVTAGVAEVSQGLKV